MYISIILIYYKNNNIYIIRIIIYKRFKNNYIDNILIISILLRYCDLYIEKL